MADSDEKSEAKTLVDAGSVLSGLVPETITSEAVCKNLEMALALAETIEDIGFEAAPVFRA